MYITIRAGYTMTIKEIRQHKNNTIRQQIFTYLIHVRKEISFIDTRFFTVSFSPFIIIGDSLQTFFIVSLFSDYQTYILIVFVIGNLSSFMIHVSGQ